MANLEPLIEELRALTLLEELRLLESLARPRPDEWWLNQDSREDRTTP